MKLKNKMQEFYSSLLPTKLCGNLGLIRMEDNGENAIILVEGLYHRKKVFYDRYKGEYIKNKDERFFIKDFT